MVGEIQAESTPGFGEEGSDEERVEGEFRQVIVLLDTSHDLDVCEHELGCRVEELFTPPLTRRLPKRPNSHFGIDNGAFAKFHPQRFLALLRRHEARKHLCRFVAVPDVPYSARRTLEVFEHWQKELVHWPLAFVAQDGQEDLPIPWGDIGAIFIGGSDKFKDGPHAEAIIRAAKALFKWVHVGRVNEPGRFEKFERLGADSIDGTGLARYTHMREAIWKTYNAPNLFNEGIAHASTNTTDSNGGSFRAAHGLIAG